MSSNLTSPTNYNKGKKMLYKLKNDYRFPYNIKQFFITLPRWCKFKYQELTKGYADCDTWGLDYCIANYKDLKKRKRCLCRFFDGRTRYSCRFVAVLTVPAHEQIGTIEQDHREEEVVRNNVEDDTGKNGNL